MTALAVGIPDARTTKEKITEMTKTLEKWIADIQYQVIKDNYLVLPSDWVSQMKRDALEELVPGEGEYSCGNCGTGLVFEFDSRAYIGKVID